MRELIRKILKEEAESQNFQQLCSSNQEVNEMMKTFTVWRSGLCNKTAIDTPEYNVKKNFGNKEVTTKEDKKTGQVHTYKKSDYLPKWEKDYKDSVAACGGSLYNATPERLKTQESCSNSVILNDYETPQIREAFNTRFGFPLGCHVNDLRTCREPVNLTPIKSKDAPNRIEGPSVEPKLKPQTPIQLPQVDNTFLQKIRKAFREISNSLNYSAYKIKQKI